MRLLNVHTLKFHEYLPHNIPIYVIASHRWMSDAEATLEDVQNKRNADKIGWKKLEGFAKYIKDHVQHVDWLWIDTCCINKKSDAELSKSINSMFKWYLNAEVCLAYLADVDVMNDLDGLKGSEWFRRGWTLQELVAPRTVVFLTQAWEVIGHKGETGRSKSGIELHSGPSLNTTIATVTGIPERVLRDFGQSKDFTVDERLSWATGRETTLEEDMSYCLVGIFDVSISVIYGEGAKHARRRLLKEVQEVGSGCDSDFVERGTLLGDMQEKLALRAGKAVPVGLGGARKSEPAIKYAYRSLKPVVSYVARPELQKQVEERLDNARAVGAARTSILILVGLGGAGKSQLALNYIETHGKDYSALFWVDARLRESVERDYRQIYSLLFGYEQDSASLQLDADRVVTAVRSWFHGCNGRSLFVFDNADSLDNETDPYFVDLQHYLPDAPCVEIIITMRSQTATDMTELEAVEVGKLAPAEAIDIFVRCCKLRNPATNVLSEAALIVDELDYLALAVTLAGAYVAATPRIRSNIREYLPEYWRRRKTLLGRKAKQQIHQYGESVLSTWETSYTAIAKQCPAAVRLLSFFAFLDSEDIFLELFRPKADSLTAHGERREDHWRRFLSPDVPFEGVLDEALEALSTYSFIQWKEEQGGYSMHKLVHTWGFDRLEEEEQGIYSSSSLAFLKCVVQERQLDPVTKSRITPHISSSVARLREWQKTSLQVPESSLDLIWSLAKFVKDTGQYHAEFELRTFEHAERERPRGKDETRWLRSLGDLAVVLSRQGNYETAEEMNRRALEGREKVLGREHPSTLTSVSNLASALRYQGKYETAEEMNRRALEGSEKVLGREHPSTLTSVSNLALLLQYQGKYEVAEEMNRRALEGSEKVLGREHPSTLTSISNLASVLQDQGKYEAAEEMNRRALEGREKVLGREHPSTLTSISNLASVLRYQGKYEAAEEMNRRALEGREKVLGREHPSTLTSISNLASVLRYQGKYEAAEEMNRRALEGREKVLGREHPSTLTSVSNLALLLQYQGKYEAAEEINRRALEGCKKVLGREHPSTLTSVSNLALLLQYQGKYEVAEEMNRRALEGNEKVLGREHPSTLTSISNLASVLQDQGKYEAAEEMNGER